MDCLNLIHATERPRIATLDKRSQLAANSRAIHTDSVSPNTTAFIASHFEKVACASDLLTCPQIRTALIMINIFIKRGEEKSYPHTPQALSNANATPTHTA